MRPIGRYLAAAVMLTGLTHGAVAQTTEPATLKSQHKAPFSIGVSNGYIGNTWRQQFLDDINTAAKELKAQGDVSRVSVLNSTSGASGQIVQINSLINSGVQALVINPVSGEALKPVIARAIAAGILVVIADDPLDDPDAINIVLDQGQSSGVETEWLVEQLGGKGNIVAIDGLAGNTASEWRIRAREAVLAKHPDVKVLAAVPADWDPAKARQVMSSLIAAHQDIDGVLVQDVMPEGVVRAYQTAGRPIPPMGGDYVKSFLTIWKANNIEALTVIDPAGIGADALQFTAALLRGYKLKPGLLQANPFKPDVINTIILPQPVAVSLRGETNKPWCTPETECISVDEALKRLDGKPDSASLDKVLTQQQVLSRYFQPK